MNNDSSLLTFLDTGLNVLEQGVKAYLRDPDLAGRLCRLRKDISPTETPSSADFLGTVTLGVAASVAHHLVEASRLLSPARSDTSMVVTLRETEQTLGAALRHSLADRLHGLYVIVDTQASRGRPSIQVAKAALQGGARVLQLRDKITDKIELLSIALRMRDLCEKYNALFIINDHADLARACEAHGYHGGQQDLPVAAARMILRSHQLVGRSNALREEVLESQAQGVDYVAVGDIFGTPSKRDTRPVGIETLRLVRTQVSVPLAAIGGINEGNVHQVMEAGVDMVCVIAAVVGADDPESAALRLIERMDEARQQR